MNRLMLIYPNDPTNTKFKSPDPEFEAEFFKNKDTNVNASLFPMSDITEKTLNRQSFDFTIKSKIILYRGPHLQLDEYRLLSKVIETFGGKMLISLENYKKGLYLPEWFKFVKNLTAETFFFKNSKTAKRFVNSKKSGKFFIKDYTNAFEKEINSEVSTPEDVDNWINEMSYFKGFVEGGICLREFENFKKESEVRLFVFDGVVFSDTQNAAVSFVESFQHKIKIPFYSIDVAKNRSGEFRVVEIGDGQVSKSTSWNKKEFSLFLSFVKGRIELQEEEMFPLKFPKKTHFYQQ